MRGARRGDAQAPRGGLAGAARHQAGSWTAQLDRCSIKQKRKNDQTVVPPCGGTVEDNGHPDESIWGESSLHQTRGYPGIRGDSQPVGSGLCDHIVRRLIAASRLSSSLPRWARYSCVQVSSWRGSTVMTTFVRSPAGSMSMVVRCSY